MNSRTLLNEKIKKLVEESVKKTFSELPAEGVEIEYPAREEHGDYASNIAMRLAGKTGENPREIAEKIINNLEEADFLEKAEIAGAGFINFFVSEKELNREIEGVLSKGEECARIEQESPETIILEYSAPNIAKPLGVHHLLSTVIGQGLFNLFEIAGFKTVAINHIGDWGTQFGKLIYAYKKWGNKEEVEKAPIDELLKLYIKFHEEAEKNPNLEDEGRKEFKKFESGNKENRDLWEWFVEESLKEINKTYNRLGGIHFDYTQGESFYEDKMEDILKEGEEKGVFVEGEEGALVIEYDDEKIPTVPIRKKDGTTLYMTRDFATLKYRLKKWDPKKILYVVDKAQSLHFKQLFVGAEKLGWHKGQGEHVSFGRMKMKDGKMSTRKGNIVLLNEVLEKAVQKAEEIIEEKNPDIPNKKEVAEKVGVGAVKYNILSQNRETDITFDWDAMLSLDGDSAPYLQYSYARAKSILRKFEDGKNQKVKTKEDGADTQEKIRNLVRAFPKFREKILCAAKERKPNILANYIYGLARKFNSYYNTVPVLGADTKEKVKERMAITEASAQIIKSGLKLLGVEVVEEM